MRNLSRLNQRIAAGIGRVWRWVVANSLSILCVLTLPLLVLELFYRYFVKKQATVAELAILGLIFLVVILSQAGTILLSRLKKIGPVEFFEGARSEYAPVLESLALKIPADLDFHGLDVKELTPEQEHAFQKAKLHLTMAELSGQLSLTEAPNKRLEEWLLQVVEIAASQRMWPFATEWLERLERVTRDEQRLAEIRYKCGLAFCLWAESSDREKELFQQAETWLQRAKQAAEKSAWSERHWIYFWLAYAEDSLGRPRLAIQHNAVALDLEPRLALAKYNNAISWIKRGALKEALECLRAIRQDDLFLENVAVIALRDKDLKALREDPTFQVALNTLVLAWQKAVADGAESRQESV